MLNVYHHQQVLLVHTLIPISHELIHKNRDETKCKIAIFNYDSSPVIPSWKESSQAWCHFNHKVLCTEVSRFGLEGSKCSKVKNIYQASLKLPVSDEQNSQSSSDVKNFLPRRKDALCYLVKN